MNKILYYPYINVPRTDWTLRTLLYYDTVGTIVPYEYFQRPANSYEPFMLELVREGLVEPINPMDVLDKPWDIFRPFIEFIEKDKSKYRRLHLLKDRNNHLAEPEFQGVRIHADKFDGEVFYHLVQLGLARRSEGMWYMVERSTANQLMKYLATIIGSKLEMQPTTDSFNPLFSRQVINNQNKRREIILDKLIPFPEEIDLKKVLKFKERNSNFLSAFRNRVELIVLDPNIKDNTPFFDEKVRELEIRKEELIAKMNEGQLGRIVLGTICGIIGASHGLITADATNTVVGAIPGFANAVYTALKIENPNRIFDQSGLKYLALVDKKIRIKKQAS